MAFQPLSVGDLMMLSQTAWKIGRAFANGKNSAPAEFGRVEREADGLSDVLKLASDTLDADDSLLSRAEPETRTAVSRIFESAQTTLEDLESFVDRYQVIKREPTNAGITVEKKSFSAVVMANYKTFKWTTEGGNITDLRNMLQMHTGTINLMMQSLQSKSLTRLEKTVVPMADQVANIHNRVNGDLGDKIDDLHRLIMALAQRASSRQGNERGISDTHSAYSSSIYSIDSTLDLSPPADSPASRAIKPPPPQSTLAAHTLRVRENDGLPSEQSDNRFGQNSSRQTDRLDREDSAYYNVESSTYQRAGRHMDRTFESGSPPDRRETISELVRSSVSSSPSYRGASSHEHGKDIARCDSSTLPSLISARYEFDYELEASPNARSLGVSRAPAASHGDPVSSRRSSGTMPVLPPPAIPYDHDHYNGVTSATGAYTDRYISGHEDGDSSPLIAAETRQLNESNRASLGSPTISDSRAFERQLFRNSAILCDVRAKVVEYAQHNPDEPDPRFSTKMVEACKEARICVIRKQEHREYGTPAVVTSIWILSDDGGVRCQQKLSDVHETVPYCSYFDPLKVSLPPTDGAISLKFHAARWGEQAQESKKTNWVNYVFVSEGDATAFQSAVFGRTLIGCYRTTKTTIIHNGLKGAFALEEQFANIEVLRLWRDSGVPMPGAEGGVLALMHVSSNFGDGWARWWINSSKQQVQIKEDGPRYAKVKGIDVAVIRPGTGASTADTSRSTSISGEALHRTDTSLSTGRPANGNRTPVKRVTGVRIEFKTDDEKVEFLRASKRVQQNMIVLPDL